MSAIPLVICVALTMQPAARRSDAQLDARAERGMGGIQPDGWQHIALRLANLTEQPVAGRATLYESDLQLGAQPRITLPFLVTDRQVLHFYPFRPPEPPQPRTFFITLDDDLARPIPHDGAAQFVIRGQSRRGVRVEMGSAPSGDFRIGLWGGQSAFMRTVLNEWNPVVDLQPTIQADKLSRFRTLLQRGGRMSPEAIALEEPRSFPDSYSGYSGLDVLMIFGADLEKELTERQRRALGDWVHSGGFLVYIPRKAEHLGGPFWQGLAGVKAVHDVTAPDDSHLSRWLSKDVGAPHQPVHFIATIDRSRAVETMVYFRDDPVVFSVPAGYGRVWLVAFDPDSHGGMKRYQPLWKEILNIAVKHRVEEGSAPTNLDGQTWTVDEDSNWLKHLSSRFGKSPTLESLAGLVVCYLLVIGPANFFVLKRREARVWLIATVPVIALIFGGVVLSMGYVTHGLRAATNQMGLAVVNPEGDRAFAEEYIGVYGTTSDVYRLGFPKNLSVRPLAEFTANPNGGFESTTSFELDSREDRMWLKDWRLTFWQTRGVATLDCVPLGGTLTAVKRGRSIAVSNQTTLQFDPVILIRNSGGRQPLGPLKAYAEQTFALTEYSRDGLDPGLPIPAEADASGEEPASAIFEDADLNWPEAERLLDIAYRRLNRRDHDWVFAFSRQPIHNVESPDSKRHYNVTLFAWPIETDRDSGRSQPSP